MQKVKVNKLKTDFKRIKITKGAVTSMILCLCLAIIPLLALFLPIITFKTPGAEQINQIHLNGLDMIQVFFNKPGENYSGLEVYFKVFNGKDFFFFSEIFTLGSKIVPISLFVSLGFSLLFIVFGVLLLVKPTFKENKATYVLALVFSFLPLLVLAAYPFIIMLIFMLKISKELEGGKDQLVGFIPAIYMVVSLIISLVLFILYKKAYNNPFLFFDDENDNDIPNFVNSSSSFSNQNGFNPYAVLPLGNKNFYGLPSNIKAIGGHAFSQNQFLEVAYVPIGIKAIGVGAFANCMHLVHVTIPRSVNWIKANAFYNCAKLKTIKYNGTKNQFKRVKRGSNWLSKAGTDRIICKDGPIIVNPQK